MQRGRTSGYTKEHQNLELWKSKFVVEGNYFLYNVDTMQLLQCELYHWIDILDIFDAILENCCRKKDDQWILPVDLPENSQVSLFLTFANNVLN